MDAISSREIVRRTVVRLGEQAMRETKQYLRLVVDRDEAFDPHDWEPALDRRAALRMMGLSALAGVLGCGQSAVSATQSASSTTTTTSSSSGSGTTSTGTTSTTSTGTTSTTTTSSSTACTQTLEGEEGPYFVDDSASGYNRSNILSNLDGTSTQTGVPFVLTLYVYDAKNACAAMAGVQIDIWHCNASGIYSAESVEKTTGQSWLRGYQISDANGMVQFVTIIPGWYQGRTTHIHLRLRSTYDSTSTGGTNTMQLFFPQTLVDTLDTTVSPYSAEGKNSTTNASDRVYSEQESGTTLMTLTGSTSAGYAATAAVYLPISS